MMWQENVAQMGCGEGETFAQLVAVWWEGTQSLLSTKGVQGVSCHLVMIKLRENIMEHLTASKHNGAEWGEREVLDLKAEFPGTQKVKGWSGWVLK